MYSILKFVLSLTINTDMYSNYLSGLFGRYFVVLRYTEIATDYGLDGPGSNRGGN